MATQQVLFAETIAGMKKAFKRKAYESDSDSEIESYTNRGNKLKKRARFAHKGQLMPTAGPGAYKESVEYAGVRRNIIHRNPPLVDEDGYEIESDDDHLHVEDAMVAAAELNPYASIRLEHVLAPLTASTDLPTHPVYSKPFTSNTLRELVSQSCGMMHKENQSLWQVRHLWTSLCGDNTWVPCETMIGLNDVDLYSDDHVARHLQSLSKGNGGTLPLLALNSENLGNNSEGGNMNGSVEESRLAAAKRPTNGDSTMNDAAAPTTTAEQNGGLGKGNADATLQAKTEENDQTKGGHTPNGVTKTNDKRTSPGGSANTNHKHAKGSRAPSEDVRMRDDSDPPNHVVPDSAIGQPSDETYIHPLFLPPPNSKLDRNLGLPESEAGDVRRLLALYVQKQEEVCRGATKLHMGLLRAERLRNEVLHWAKAEAHCGQNRDLSDGEDWYDKEAWGLTEDLKKGQDEEEEDTVTAGKKTRNRR